MDVAERFVDLACLMYGADESRARREEAAALLDARVVEASVHAAAAAGDLDALRAHLDRDPASVGRKAGPRAWEPVMSLCYSRVAQRDALGCLDVLLARGADPNAHIMFDECRFTALTGVIGEGEAGPFEQAPHPQARAMAERLLDAGADPNDSQAIYNTHFRPSNAWLELLLARGASPMKDLRLVLGQAALQDYVDRVRLLLRHGVPADGQNFYNKRPHLENALLAGNAEIATLLAAAGARPPVFDDGERFRVAVLANDEAEARRYPVPRDSGALIAAARHGRIAAATLALDLGVPIDEVDHEGLTALHHAARNGYLEMVRMLVARGAPLAARDRRYGGTPLGHAEHFAERWARGQAVDVVAFLRDRAP